MNEKVKQAQETLLKLSGLALKYLINNFNYENEEYLKLKQEIGNLTDKLRLALNDFDRYHESQQDLINGKDEYIAKLCNDRAEKSSALRIQENNNIHLVESNLHLMEENKELKEFAKLVSIKSVDMLILRQANKNIDYEASVFMPYTLNRKLTQAEFDLIKKVVEKYGK